MYDLQTTEYTDVAMEDLVQSLTEKMNHKQQLALTIAVEHLRGDHPDALSLIISGEDGTGKSFVIQAISKIARKIPQQNNPGSVAGKYGSVLIAVPTEVAAFHVGGRTIQSVLNMGGNYIIFATTTYKIKNYLGRRGNKSDAVIQRQFSGTYLVILDEYSMISAEMLMKLDQFLCKAFPHKRELLFRGCHMVFCGDFCQIPPVMGTRLYKNNQSEG